MIAAGDDTKTEAAAVGKNSPEVHLGGQCEKAEVAAMELTMPSETCNDVAVENDERKYYYA
jgi:hypothetical protein